MIMNNEISVIKRHRILNERIQNRIMYELIIESFDKETSKQAIELIKRLNAIKWPTSDANTDPFSLFKSATKSAISELQHALAGAGRNKNLFDKIVTLFKKEDDNPFVDVIAYASTLYDFFTTMNHFVEAMKGKDTDTLYNILGGTTGTKTLEMLVTKGLSPNTTGLLGKLGTNWTKKYLKGLNVKEFVVGLSQMTKKQTRDIASQVIQQLSNIKDVANRTVAADNAAQHGKDLNTPEEKQADQSKKEISTTQTAGSEPAKQPEIQSGHQIDVQKAVLTKIKPAIDDLGIKNPERLIAALYDLGVLKSPE